MLMEKLNELYWDTENGCFTEERKDRFGRGRADAAEMVITWVRGLLCDIEVKDIHGIHSTARTVANVLDLLEAEAGDKSAEVIKEIGRKWQKGEI